MQEIKLQPFIRAVLQKNTYNSPRNNHANPSCNTFLQEKCQNMPKNVFLQQVRLTKSAKYPREGANFKPPYEVNE
jgi:hypothetical protein